MAKFKQKTSSIPKNTNPFQGWEKYFLLIVLAVTFFCFLPTLQNKLVNLDDPQYLIDNPVVKDLNAENLKKIFIAFHQICCYKFDVISFFRRKIHGNSRIK